LRDQILQAQADRDLPQNIRPREFFAWANDRNIDFPIQLEQAVLANEVDIVDLQRRYERLDERNSDLLKENQDLRYQLECQRTATAPAPKEVSTKERASLLKMVIAMATDGYGYDPYANKSPIPRQIAQIIQDKGMRLDEDTVRVYLRKAVADELPARENDR
jgi:regulator of replication initiation timing